MATKKTEKEAEKKETTQVVMHTFVIKFPTKQRAYQKAKSDTVRLCKNLCIEIGLGAEIVSAIAVGEKIIYHTRRVEKVS